MGTNETTARETLTPPDDNDYEMRRPDLSLVERIELAKDLLLKAPQLPTREEKRMRLIAVEGLLRYCVRELEAILDDPSPCGVSFRREGVEAEGEAKMGRVQP
jgi:hypothetical protein